MNVILIHFSLLISAFLILCYFTIIKKTKQSTTIIKIFNIIYSLSNKFNLIYFRKILPQSSELLRFHYRMAASKPTYYSSLIKLFLNNT